MDSKPTFGYPRRLLQYTDEEDLSELESAFGSFLTLKIGRATWASGCERTIKWSNGKCDRIKETTLGTPSPVLDYASFALTIKVQRPTNQGLFLITGTEFVPASVKPGAPL